MEDAHGTYQSELELCSWLASKSMPCAANEPYLSTIKSHLLPMLLLPPFRLAADGFQGWRPRGSNKAAFLFQLSLVETSW